VYLTAFEHTPGKRFIYEGLKLYTLILQEAKPPDCEEICLRFGREEVSLWSDALAKLASAQCPPGIAGSFLDRVREKRALPFLVGSTS
jgi:hypothetical protein